MTARVRTEAGLVPGAVRTNTAQVWVIEWEEGNDTDKAEKMCWAQIVEKL